MMTIVTWDAESYSENSQLQYIASTKFLSTLELYGAENILDIGCGTGALTNAIAAKAPHGKVVGIDSSESMINYASENFRLNNLEFKIMNAEELSLPLKFDIIISNFCVHWIKDKKRLFQNIASHIHSDGQIRIIMPFKHVGIANIRHNLMTKEKWSHYFDNASTNEILIFDNQYDVYADKAGLDNIIFETENVTTSFEDSVKLKSFLRNITPYLHLLPTEELRDEFMNDIVTEYLRQEAFSTSKGYSITYTYGKLRSSGLKQSIV